MLMLTAPFELTESALAGLPNANANRGSNPEVLSEVNEMAFPELPELSELILLLINNLR